MVARIDRTGEVNYNKFGSKMKIIRYKNAKEIDVYFEEYNWIKYNIEYKSFKNGLIKCPYERRTYNIGYLGEGKYERYKDKKNTKCYDVWHNMLKRCYDVEDIGYDRYGKRGVIVCEEWHNYQNFAEWYYSNYYECNGELLYLDKDILNKGNKIYSPNTCILVPRIINNIFTKSDKARGEYLIGVRQLPSGNFQAYYNSDENNKFISLGVYGSQEEAFQHYKIYKEKVIKRVADEYKPYIPKKLYDAMYRYEVEITD